MNGWQDSVLVVSMAVLAFACLLLSISLVAFVWMVAT